MNNGIRIRNIEPQEITIEGATTVAGITNVYVNGVDVTVGTKAYVIVPTKTSELTNDSGFITSYTETDPTVPAYVKAISLADINAWNDKQNELVSGVNIKTINNNSLLGSGDIQITATEYQAGTGIDITGDTISNTITSYQDLTNLPTIPTTTGELINTSGFINNTVNDLTNYIRADLLEDILPSVSDSGTELYLQDTAPYTLHLELKPSELSQFTTTGKNLLPYPYVDTTKSSNGIEYTVYSDGTIKAHGTATSNSIFTILNSTSMSYNKIREMLLNNTCYLGGCPSGGSSSTYTLQLYGYTSSGTGTLRDIGNGIDLSLFENENNSFNIAIFIGNGTIIDNLIFKPQIEIGNTATSYEPYTGGIPSPNPDYPQDIHVISGTNNINICNKNLFDKETAQQGYYYTTSSIQNSINWYIQQIKVKPNTTYYLSGNNYNNSNAYIVLLDENKDIISSVGAYPSVHLISTGATTEYIGLSIADYSGTGDMNTIMLEAGSTATSYVPHEERNYPIELDDIELTKISTQWGDYENFIFKNSLYSPWYDSSHSVNSYLLGSRVFKYTLTSVDNWELLPTGVFSTPVNYNQLGSTKHYAVCNYFQDFSDVNDTDTDSWILTQGNSVYLHFNSSLNINTVSDLQTWLDNNEVVFYAIRGGLQDNNANASYIDYSIESQWFNAVNSIGYDDGTNISQDNFDRPFELSAKTIQKVTN